MSRLPRLALPERPHQVTQRGNERQQTFFREDEPLSAALRRGETIGRPLGGAAFLGRLEGLAGRCLKPQKRGPKGKGARKRALSA